MVKTNLIEVNKIYSYKQLCALFEEDVKSGSSKRSQLKEWKRHFEFEKAINPKTHKIGAKFLIVRIYDEPLEKEDGRKNNGGRSFTDYPNFKVDESIWNSKGVYKIETPNKKIYIGSTIRGFRNRFIQHYNGAGGNDMTDTKALLDEGGIFEVIWLADNNVRESVVRKIEQYYIDMYNRKTGYTLMNRCVYKDRQPVKKKKGDKGVQKGSTRHVVVKSEFYEEVYNFAKENGYLYEPA